MSKSLPLFSMGVGDRFGHQGRAQLRALRRAKEVFGVEVVPVWNKSNREHQIIGTRAEGARAAADAAVKAEGYAGPYFVDADHIVLKTVDAFVAPCDFFTLDVADFVGQPPAEDALKAFAARHAGRIGTVTLPLTGRTIALTAEAIAAAGRKYLAAVCEAGRIYRHLAERKGAGTFVTEVSMDETDLPQTPAELLIILLALADEKVPAQTIAPKFTGRFNKGVDYVGDVDAFAREFEDDVAVVRWAQENLPLPANMKLSVHSGSDKFSLYPRIGATLRRHGAGVHLKTAGTTWLEEVIGLAAAGGEGLALAKEIYALALPRAEALCAPYSSFIYIDRARLPDAATVRGWSSEDFTAALRHEPDCPRYNPNFRQLLHVGYKVAAELGPRYHAALETHAAVVAENVEHNLFERHLRRLLG